MKLTKDREYQSELVKRAKVIKEEYERIKEEKIYIKSVANRGKL